MSTLPVMTLSGLSDDESDTLNRLVETVRHKAFVNGTKTAYYEGRQRVQDLGIAIPPHLLGLLETAVGWPGQTVDVLEERLDIDGFTVDSNDDVGLDEIVDRNSLDVESGYGHLDSLMYGTAFVTLGTFDDGVPLITVESPKWATAEWSRRERRETAGVSLVWDDHKAEPEAATLYLPGENVFVERTRSGWTVQDRDVHGQDRVLMHRLVNRPRSGDMEGRSEITRPVRAYTDNAVRTLLGMEIAREFFSAPQRYLLGADESAFVDADGNPRTAWETYLGRILAISADEDGNMPQVGTFQASSPGPYLDQLRGLAQLLAAEAAIPVSYLGFFSDNPSSADAIRAMEARLVKRAERRQKAFGAVWTRVLQAALSLRDGGVGVTPMPNWKSAATPTAAAEADAAVKLVGSGILPADSDVVRERVGLSATDRKRLDDDSRRGRADTLIAQLANVPELVDGDAGAE